jgi:hypothetical protein
VKSFKSNISNCSIKTDSDSGQCKVDYKLQPSPFLSTKTGQIFPASLNLFTGLLPRPNSIGSSDLLIHTCVSATLLNGDDCKIKSWVLVSDSTQLKLCQVVEILQVVGSSNQQRSSPDAFLLQHSKDLGFAKPYEMPHIIVSNDYSLVPLEA